MRPRNTNCLQCQHQKGDENALQPQDLLQYEQFQEECEQQEGYKAAIQTEEPSRYSVKHAFQNLKHRQELQKVKNINININSNHVNITQED